MNPLYFVEQSHKNEIEFRFEELPLLTDGQVSGGLLNGTATVSYFIEDGSVEWFVREIYLDGYRGFDRVPMKVENDTPLYLTIWGVLTDGSFKEAVSRSVEKDAREMMEAV
jgi:hypothetical protein